MSTRLNRGALTVRTLLHRFSLMLGVLSLAFATSVAAVSPNIVISQIYGGGGNAGSVYRNDFIELFNRGATPVNVTGWSVQYSSAAGTTWTTTALTGTIPAGGYYLVQEAVGTGGTTNLPTPDVTGTIAMSATAAKVALMNTSTALTGACPSPGATVVDFVGYGTGVSCFEGAATPAPSNTTAVLRALNGCTDTDANNTNFATGAPNPRNSAAPANICTNISVNSVTLSEGNAGTTTFNFTVTLSAALGVATTFDIATADGTAIAGSDYVAKALTGQTIPAGSTTYSFTVDVNGDTLPETNETFSVALSNVSPSSLIVVSPGIGTITNDDAAPNLSINNVSLNEGDAGTTSFTFTVSLSAPAPAGGVTFDIATANGTASAGSDYAAQSLTAQTIPAGSSTYTFTVLVNGDTVAEPSETFAVNVSNIVGAIGVTTSGTGTIVNDDVYPIHDVQGSGTASPVTGQVVTVEGIVTADFQGANQLKGFYIQEPDAKADADPATSEGVFVFTNLTPFAVTPGDLVRVTGTVVEFGTAPNTLTEIVTPTITTISTGNPLPALTTVSLPVATAGALERYEGMRVQFTQSLTVSDHFDLAHFGEVTLSANGRSFNPTNVVDPNDDPASGTANATNNAANVAAYADLNARSRILLDDASTLTYPPTIPFADPVTGSLRLGSTVSNLTGILSQSFGTHRIYATAAPVFAYAPRPLTPPAVGGNLKVGAMNVLNYFNGDGLGGGFPTSRGANTLAEFNRQRAKVIAALLGLDADIVTLMEIENDGTGPTSAVQDLVNGLNASAGAGVWAFVGDPAGWGTINGSTDQIKATIIYKTAKVTPVGPPTSPNDPAFVNARAPVAQTFQLISNGEQLTVIANHFKSKSSGGTGLDADLGQGFFNNARTLQAGVLLNFIGTFTGSPRVIALGDFNAYEQEDPIDTLRAGGLSTLINNTYSYMFDGLSGSLDHALGNATLVPNVVGADKWHINADEPVYLDYNVETKNNPGCVSQCTTPDLYTAIPFRASDHDPVLVGLQINGPQCAAGSFSVDGFAPCTLASPGSFVAVAGATSQTLCAAGTFSAVAGAVACTNASPGNYVPTTGATAQIAASAGSFVSVAAATAQTLCAAGSFSPTTGATACTLAGLGFFVATTGATAQTACPVGTTTLVTGSTACVPITFTVTASAGAGGTIAPNGAQTVNFGTTPLFTITASAGFTASVAAGVGECGGTLTGTAPNYSYTTVAISANCNVTASFAASQCLAGTFSATGNAPCTTASAGNFVPTAGATSQTPASPGSFVAGAGATSQTLCAAGTFSAAAGAIACTPASAGNFVATAGATSQTPASPGSFVSGTGATSQTLCSAGSFSPAAGAVACTLASAGNFVPVAGAIAQTPASAGSFVATAGATSQTLCVAGTFSATTGATACTPAAIGFFVAAAGATSQAACPVGTTTLATGAAACVAITLTVTPSAGANGTITPSTPQTVAFNATPAFTVTPNTGFTASIATGAGNCGGTLVGTTYTTAPVTANCSVSATFTAVPLIAQTITGFAPPASVNFGAPPVTLSAVGGGSGNAIVFATTSAATVCAVSGTAVTFNGIGTCNLTANQAAANGYTAAPQVTASIVINQGPQTIAFNPPATVGISSGSFALSGVSSSGLPLSYVSNSPATCTVTGTTVRLVSAGTCSVTASQPGNANYLAAPSVTRTFVIGASALLASSASSARVGEILTLTFAVAGNNPSGTAAFTTGDGAPIPGCAAAPVANGIATCIVPSRYTLQNPLTFAANYSGDAGNPPVSSFLQQSVLYDLAVLSTSIEPVNAVAAGSRVTVTALVRMRSPVGTVTFYPANAPAVNPVPIPGCNALPLAMLPGATDSAVATCSVTAPQSGATQVVAVYNYPAGHISNRVFEQEVQSISVANIPANYTDMWWSGIRENGWGVSITQHGTTQVNVIYTYDNLGKPLWYFMSGCTLTANNTCTGNLYQPTGSSFSQYDVTRFAVNAPVGTATFTYKTAGTATMSYTINGVSGTKEIEREIFAAPTTLPNLAVNDLWWNGLAENGWGMNIAQQGRQLFPVWYTYDANGKNTFYAVPGGTWNGLTFTGDIYTTTSSAWLGVPYDPAKFVPTKVGTMVIDYRDANTATMTYTVGNVTQTKLITRQAF